MKKKNDNTKKLAKLAKVILYETTGTYLRSEDMDTKKLLSARKMGSYVSDDMAFNYLIYIDDVMRKAEIDNALQLKIDSIVSALFELQDTNDKKLVYDTLNKLTDDFLKTVDFANYFKLARKMILSAGLSSLLSPIFFMFDYLYAPEEIIYGEENQKKISKQFEMKIENEKIPLVLCFLGSWGGLDPKDKSTHYFFNAIKKYIEIGTPHLVKSFAGKDSHKFNSHSCGVALFYKQNAVLNKFLFNYSTPAPMYKLEKYTLLTSNLEEQYFDIKIALCNLLLKVDKKILTHRNYIYHNTDFQDILLDIWDEHGSDPLIPLIDHFHIQESEINYFGENYYIIFFSYNVGGYDRTIPFITNNFFVLFGGLSCIDLNNIFLLFALYDLIQECSAHISDFDKFKEIIKPFIEIADRYHNMSIDADSGIVHQRQLGHKQHCEEIKVDAFVRSLPKGQKASESAIELAKKYNLNLGEGKTIVSSYIRNKNKT